MIPRFRIFLRTYCTPSWMGFYGKQTSLVWSHWGEALFPLWADSRSEVLARAVWETNPSSVVYQLSLTGGQLSHLSLWGHQYLPLSRNVERVRYVKCLAQCLAQSQFSLPSHTPPSLKFLRERRAMKWRNRDQAHSGPRFTCGGNVPKCPADT